MAAKAKQLKAEGKAVVAFTVGEPDFKTPEHICEAARKAIGDRLYHAYTPSPGLPKLREAAAAMFKRDIGVTYEPKQVVVSPGAKYSLFLAMQTLLNDGDEVIIPAPYWVSYPEMVKLCGGKPVFVETKEADGFSVTADAIDAVITPKTKMVILNSPSNPTGGIVPPAEVEKIAKVIEKRGVWCLADEIYDKLIYAGATHKSIASCSDYARDHTVVVNGVSKTYAMTGWRIGFTAGPAKVLAAIDDLQSQTTSNACGVAQAAAIAALEGPQECVKEMVAEFAARRDLISKLLNGVTGVTCGSPLGAFYALPNVSGLFGKKLGGVKVNTPSEIASVWLDQVYVASVAGEPFGTPSHIRLSYATSRAEIEEGVARLKKLSVE